jgi:phospholipid/cholesterol/gamma-HCH transport system substrate-binding protein
MRKSLETEIKVGVFVSIGLGLVMLAIIILGGDSLLTRKNTFYSFFPNVEGLIPGAKVTLNGMSIGLVDALDFDAATHLVRVEFSVSKNFAHWIRTDSQSEIATQGVLGDKFISVTPGSAQTQPLANGATIPVLNGKDLSHFIHQGDQLMSSVNQIAANLDKTLKDFNTERRSEIFFKGIAKTATNLERISETLQHEVDHIQLKEAITHLNQILSKINNGTGTIGALINDPGLYDQLNALVGGANRSWIMRNLIRQTIKESAEHPEKP